MKSVFYLYWGVISIATLYHDFLFHTYEQRLNNNHQQCVVEMPGFIEVSLLIWLAKSSLKSQIWPNQEPK